MEGGLVQNIVARNDAPVIAHVVDYDTEGGGETEIVEIPQGEGKTAGAFLQCYDGKLDRQATEAFWTALKQCACRSNGSRSARRGIAPRSEEGRGGNEGGLTGGSRWWPDH